MAGEWEQLRLREANVTLIDCDHRTPVAADAGYPYVAIPQLRNGRIDLSDARRITREQFLEWTRKAKPKADDVVLSRRCNPGETAFVPSDLEFALGQNLVLLRADGTRVYPPFLRWLVRGPEWWEQIGKFLNVGAVFDSLRCGDVPNFQLLIPPMDEQRAIAHILGTLDNKIELNQQTNETLEAIARALFKSWFVDFDPVQAKAEGRDPGLPKPLADLFPDSFEDSPLGKVPMGWCTSSVYDLATYINGAAYQAFEPNEERRGLPIIKIAELKAGVTTQTRFSAVDMPNKYRIDTGDILFSWSGNPDTSIDIFVWPHGPAWLNQHIFRVVARSVYERAFVLMTLRTLRPVFAEIARNKQTTGLGHVTVEDLKRLLAVKPPEPVLRGWNTIIDPVLARSFALEKESNTVAVLRDTLLPKLISGELRVKDGERIIAEGT
jgi:type I restriction enzyme, S subunit